MTNYPSGLDDDSTLPPVNDNIDQIGADAINALRDAVIAIETILGINISGSAPDLATRLGVFINPDGTPNASIIYQLGLVTLPITNSMIAPAAGIEESKLSLNYKTQDLFNYITDLSRDVNIVIGWINVTGVKLEPHIDGTYYRHDLAQIDVAEVASQYLNNRFRINRDNSNSYNLISDINNEFLAHQWADGSQIPGSGNVVTNNGSIYPYNYAHIAGGIFINTSRFASIPQTINDVQQFADYIDSSSLFLIGTRLQNFYSNGISVSSRSSSLITDGYGQPIVPNTPATAYLLDTGSSSSPFDDINAGDDIIEFTPSTSNVSSNTFDAQFALVRVGDILRINYGTIQVQFIVKEKKYIQSGGNKKYYVRVNGKNLFYTTSASARIDRPLYTTNKYGDLSLSAVNNAFGSTPSLIVGTSRGAQILGIGFNPDSFDGSHYMLYLALNPTGNPADGYAILPGIDVTGDRGTRPGSYTLDSIVAATNNAFRQNGYNYRFISFQYQGEFGIMLADSYNNAGFSILSGVVDSSGFYNQTATNIAFPNNVVGLFPNSLGAVLDPLGFGILGSNVASPPYKSTYPSAEAAQVPTQVFVPLKQNTFYVNGVEKERLDLDIDQTLDIYGDGYWNATITNKQIFPGSPGRIQVTYRILQDLATSNLEIGKTLVVKSSNLVDSGRFIISNINFGCPNQWTDITVYDAVHAAGIDPTTTAGVGTSVAIYFNSDSVSFNKESATDINSVTVFKKNFEIYIDQNANTFTHERCRFNISGSPIVVNGVTLNTYSEFSKFDIIDVSPKLKGYLFGSVSKITLHVNSFSNSTGLLDGYLSSFDGTNYTHVGPTTIGKQGEVIRFYDESNIDYIDIMGNISTSISSFNNQNIDFQLFPSLSWDQEIMLLGTCQVNDLTGVVNILEDDRQFGNISEQQFSSSAIDFINAGNRLLHTNGVIRGFDTTSVNNNQISMMGGVALVNGNLININAGNVIIPAINELNSHALFEVSWYVCVNDQGEIISIPSRDILFTQPDRIFDGYNPVNNLSYNIDSASFIDFINNRRDLCLLYFVISTVTDVGGNLTVSLAVNDARKYVNQGDTVFPITLTSDNTQGNFRSFESLLTWLALNQQYNSTVILRGNLNVNNPITIDFSTSYAPVVFIGDGAVINVSSARGFTIGSNVEFRNIHFNYNYTALGDGTYNTNNLVNSSSALIYCAVPAAGAGQAANFPDQPICVSNVTIENCLFTYTSSTTSIDRYPFVSFEFTTVSSVAQNIQIKNNKFLTQASIATTDDVRAVIAFICKQQTSPDVTKAGIRLQHCSIEENICNKNQMIIISAESTNSGGIKILDALTTVNCNISRNICGTIGFATRADTPTNFANNVFVNDKYNELLIDGNNCKGIICADSTGFVVQTLSGPSIIPATGPLNICNNTSSWIYVAADCASTSLKDKKGVVYITNNIIPAYDSVFIHNFIQIGGLIPLYVGAAAIYVIYANPLFGGSHPTDVFIQNNRIGTGEYLNNSNGLTTYNYTYGIYNVHNAAITDNIFNDLDVGGSGIFIQQVANQSIIKSNTFYRSTAISAYIDLQSTANATGHIITNNSFDQSTVDGSSINLVINIPVNTIYQENRNQTSYLSTQINAYATEQPPSANIRTQFARFEVVSLIATVEEAQIINHSQTGASTVLYYTIDLNGLLPLGVLVEQATVGLYLAGSNSIDTMSTSTFDMHMIAGRTNAINMSAPSGSIVDVYNAVNVAGDGGVIPASLVSSPQLTLSAGTIAAFESSTQYLLCDVVAASKTTIFITNKSTPLLLQIKCVIASSGTGMSDTYQGPTVTSSFFFSPLVIKYKW